MSTARVRKTKLLYATTASISTLLFKGRLTYFKNKGFDVHLASSPGKELEDRHKEEGITIHPLPMRREISIFYDIPSFVRAYLLVRRLKPDIVDVGAGKAGLLFILSAFLCRVPCRVYTMRGLRFETIGGILNRILRGLDRIICACAHKVICISPSLRQKAIELQLGPPDKFVVIGSGSSRGVSIEWFAFTPERQAQVEYLRQKLGLASTSPLPPVVGFVGRLVRDKGIKELIQAYFLLKNRFPSLRLLLVGEFEEGDPIDIETRQLIKETPEIITVGFVDDPVPYYYLMDILAFPTHREGFGNVSIEANAAGKPVVTTDATGAIDSVINGVTGYIVPKGNAKALADAIARLLENPDLARQMGEAGRKRVIAEFQPEQIWQGIEKLYAELLMVKKKV